MNSSKSCEKKPKSWNQKLYFLWIFFWGGEWKKTKKLQKCNFATLQLFGLVAFFYCFLIKKGKKQQKLQSCKVAFLQLLVFFSKIPGPKNAGFFWWIFFSRIISLIIPDHTLISEVWIPETLSLFFWGLDLNSFDFRNLTPIFLVGMDLNSFYFRNLIPIFLVGMDLNSFYFRNLIPIFWGGFGSQFSFQKRYPYFFGGMDFNSFHFRNLLPIF